MVRHLFGVHFMCTAIFLLAFALVVQANESESKKNVNIGDGRNKNWAEKLVSAIKARDAFIPKLREFKDRVDTATIKDLLEPLDVLSKQLDGLDALSLTGDVEQDVAHVGDIKSQSETSLVTEWFDSGNLENYYTMRGFGFVLKKLKQQLTSSPYKLSRDQLDDICNTVLEDVGKTDRFEITTEKVCKSVKECSGKDEPRLYGDTSGTNLQDVCDGDSCNVQKAVPVMSALLWYKVSDYIALAFCHNNRKEPSLSVVRDKRYKTINMADFVSGYVSTLENWSEFFTDAASRRAFSNLPLAMELVNQRQKSFKFAALACRKLEAMQMCSFGDIFPYYSSLVKIKKDKQNRPLTKNLRLHARVDHVKLLELTRESLQHLEVLGNLEELDYNVENFVNGTSTYFYELAKYDQGIADQDIAFLKGKLNDFEKLSSELSEKVQSDTKHIMIAANFALASQLFDEIAMVVIKTAQHANPFKTLFTGIDLSDLYEQAGEIARASQELARGIALFGTFSTVYNDMATLATKFQKNREQIDRLLEMVNSIENNRLADADADSERFIESYGGYTPHVNRNDLAKNDALWSAYKDSTCDLLFGAEGIKAAVTRGAVGGMLLCENLESSLAQFFGLRENIFDFQFDLVDSMASAVRGNIAKKLAEDIDVKNDRLKPEKLLQVFFMTQYRLQFEASLYCDKLEYLNQGQTVTPCNGKDFLDNRKLEDLLSYDFGTQYHEAERFVYIPTKPQFPGDTGFISISELAKGEPVSFRIPANRTWLRRFNWLSSDETLAPFVASFKLYLPLRTYRNKKRRDYTKTSLEIVSTAGSRIDENQDVLYNLPLEHSIYATIYEEGYDSAKCPRGKEIMNPYSLCDNLPLLCDTMTRVPGSLIMPTILSTWKITCTVQSGHINKRWNAPRPATDMHLVAKVKLRFLPGNGRKKRASASFRGEPAFGCCSNNTYRPMWNDKQCVPCPTTPTQSKAKMKGYYCAKGSEEVAQNIPENFYTFPTKTPPTTAPGH